MTPRGASADEVKWYEFRWGPQTLGTLYQPLFATRDPQYAFSVDLACNPDKDRRLALICWRLEAPGMAFRDGVFAIDYVGGGLARLAPLDWPVYIEPVGGGSG